jgi:hypothetical protein
VGQGKVTAGISRGVSFSRGRLWSWKKRMLVELAATMGHLRVEFLGGRRRKGKRERGA